MSFVVRIWRLLTREENMKIFVSLISILFVGQMAMAVNCTNYGKTQTYPLFCKGKLYLEINDGGESEEAFPTISFQRNFTKSGVAGTMLKAGTCAWADRALNANEPASLTTWINPTNGNTVSSAILSMISRCSADASCVFEVCAYREGPTLKFVPWTAATMYP